MNSRTVLLNSMPLVIIIEYYIYQYNFARIIQLLYLVLGLKTDGEYPGIYEWQRVDTATDANAASTSFTNWQPSECRNK